MACAKVELTRQNRKAGATLFAMNQITQTMRYRQFLFFYAQKYGVTEAAKRYNTNRQYIYRWMKRYDGTLQSLADRSHRPATILISTGLVVFWVKLRQRGYTRSISGLYRFLIKRGQMAVEPPNPKYIPKPYEQMQYPCQRGQIDVKFVPAVCLVGEASGEKLYQYTFIDKYSSFRYLEAFKEHSTYSSTTFLRHVVEKFPYAIDCIQTDNGSEFTNRLNSNGTKNITLFEKPLSELGIRHKLIRTFTPRHNGKVERSHRKDNEELYVSHRFFSFDDFSKQLADRQRQYNNFPMRPLNWRSPIQVLFAFSTV